MVWGQSRPLELFPQPQRIVISNEYCNFDQGVMLKGIDNPDKDAVEILKQVLPLTQSAQSFPLEVKKMKAKKLEMKRSGAYTLNVTLKGITIGIVDDRSLFYAAQTLKQLATHCEEGKHVLPLFQQPSYFF